MGTYIFYIMCLLLTTICQQANANCSHNRCDSVNGLCWSTGRDTSFCSCKAGFRPHPSFGTRVCQDIDECNETPDVCGRNTMCSNYIGGYECNCRCGYVEDYTGKHCLEPSAISDVCLTPSACVEPSNPFGRTVDFHVRNSRNYITDYYSSYVRNELKINRFRGCVCEKGFRINRCGYCVDIDECVEQPGICSGTTSTCINTEGSFYCECSGSYVLGPCGRRCYPPRTELKPFCEDSNLEILASIGFEFRSFNRPILIENYRFCASGLRTGELDTQRYNLDTKPGTDVILTWECQNARRESVLKNIAEAEARWDEWTCWTACKATCWGGVQTRVRTCLNGLPGLDGCTGAGSESRNCYSGPRCAFRVRKDARLLTSTEIDDIVQAMENYKRDDTAMGYFAAAAAHGWPGQCNGASCCPHGAKILFLTWHRSIMLNFEEGFTRYLRDKSLGLPYWNWLAPSDRRGPPPFVLRSTYRGRTNPFANMTVLIDRTGPMRTIQRDPIHMGSLDRSERQWLNIAAEKMDPWRWHDFAEAAETAHGGPHVSGCGSGRFSPKCTVSFATLDFSSFDPLFLFHHCNVDRLWAVAQDKMRREGSTAWNLQTALEAFEDPSVFSKKFMPFGNTDLNPFPIVQATNTMRDAYYYEELTGVRYDYVGNRGYPPVSARQLDATRKAQGAALFVAHYFQSTPTNFYVNYYEATTPPTRCNRYSTASRLGGASRLGTSSEFRQNVPHLTLISAQPLRANLDEDMNVVACYTRNTDCRERCPEITDESRILTMPTPNLVYYVPNQPVDILKFNWATGQRMPPWYINILAINQYVYFYGARRNNIVQVRTSAEYLRCDARNGQRFDCTINNRQGGACMLPSGIYFLIDTSSSNCRRGLKMIIVSRLG